MVEILAKLWRMGLKASVLILFVFLVRWLLRRYPKIYSYGLWALVGISLLCPLSIRSPFSLQPALPNAAEFLSERQDAGAQASTNAEGADHPVDLSGMDAAAAPVLDLSMEQGGKGVLPTAAPSGKAVKHNSDRLLLLLGTLYLLGAGTVLGCYLVQYARVRRRTTLAVHEGGDVWLCDAVPSPFVIGVIKPRILLPYGLPEPEKTHILLHERTHIRHHDPLARLVCLLCVCLHWWNPLVWLAARGMEQDMEMFCDESALRHADLQGRKAYAKTLLLCARRAGSPAIGPAFGESNTERRVENIMKKRKNSLVVLCGVLLLAVFGAVAFMTNPKAEEGKPQEAPVYFGEFALADGKMYKNFSEDELSDTLLALPVETEYCAIYKNKLYYTADYIDRTIDYVPDGHLTIYSCGLDGTDQQTILEIPEIYRILGLVLRDDCLYLGYMEKEREDTFTVVRLSLPGKERTECTLSSEYGGLLYFEENRVYSRNWTLDGDWIFYVHNLDTGESEEVYRCSDCWVQDYCVKDGSLVMLLSDNEKIWMLSVDENKNIREHGDFEGKIGRLFFGKADYCSIDGTLYRLDEKQDAWLPLENVLPEYINSPSICPVMEDGVELYYIIGGEVSYNEWSNTFLMQYNTKSGERKLLREYYSP